MSAPSPADPLGFDVFVGIDDMDRLGRSATGAELAEAEIAHRLTCAQLACLGAPGGVIDYGEDVRTWVGEPLDRAGAALKATRVDAALQRSPRVAKTDTSVSLAPEGVSLGDGSTVRLLIDVTVTLRTGERISRIVGVSDISVGFLAGGS